jgi:transcription antitermination factor NusB
MTKTRRSARELALNVLFQTDVAKIPFEEALETALDNVSLPDEAQNFARELAEGAFKHHEEADAEISELSAEWPLDRQPAVDRNILRLAVYEIRYIDSIPPVVSVNEAIELAKKYSTADSGKFINGVLAACLRKREQAQEAS